MEPALDGAEMNKSNMKTNGLPPRQGLYDPFFEHESCGVGFVVNVKGTKSHQIVQQALQVLRNLDHRGACGCEANTGDGAGILLQMPHAFLQKQCEKLGFKLPKPGQYGAGLVFMPQDPPERQQCERAFEKIVKEEGLKILGWRTLPTDNSSLGATAKASEPLREHEGSHLTIQQLTVGTTQRRRSGGECKTLRTPIAKPTPGAEPHKTGS